MARADLLKKLFSSFNNEDRELFLKTAHEIIEDERKKNHSILADDLEQAVIRLSRHIGRSEYGIKQRMAL
jgi:hypothetical protein